MTAQSEYEQARSALAEWMKCHEVDRVDRGGPLTDDSETMLLMLGTRAGTAIVTAGQLRALIAGPAESAEANALLKPELPWPAMPHGSIDYFIAAQMHDRDNHWLFLIAERDKKIVRLRRLILRASAVLETVEYDNDPPQRVVDLTNELRSVNREKLGICDAAMIAQQENGNE